MKKMTLAVLRDGVQVASEGAEDATSREKKEYDLDVERQMAQAMAYIALLPEKYQLVLRLYDIEGHSYSEVAHMLARPVGTIKCQVSRGRQLLRRLLKSGETEMEQAFTGNQYRGNPVWPSPETIARMEMLPRPYRMIMGLHYREKYSYSEMARLLGKPVGTVKSQVYRGMQMLLEA